MSALLTPIAKHSFHSLSLNSIAMYNTLSITLSLLCRATRFIFALLWIG
jgi:hypothetical protein